MTYVSETCAMARQHILSDLDEVIAQIVLQADRIERLRVAVPVPVAKEVAQRLVSIAAMLTHDVVIEQGNPQHKAV